MRAVVYKGPFQVAVEEVPEPRLEADTDALLEVELSAICGSDLHIYHGKIAGVLPGTVLGHEFVGRIVEKGPLVPFPVGERVVGSFQVACGECPACRKGQFFACSRGGVFGFGLALGNLPGAQAERVRVPFARHTLFPIGDLPAEEAILAGDILTTAYGGVRPFLTPGMSVAVVGSGPVGLMAQMVAHALGAGQVYAIDPEEARLEKTKALKLALRLAGPGGVVSSLGVPTAERLDYPWLPAFSRGITLRSALANVPRWIGEVLALQKAGRLKGSFVFSHRLPLEEAPEGYRLFHERKATKVALVP